MLLYGNWYAEIETRRGRVHALWPIPPWRVSPTELGGRGIVYEVSLPDGGYVNIPYSNMLHIKNLSLDGLRGMSCIQAGAEAIGLSLAAQEFGAKFFAQGANMGGVAEHPGKLSEQGSENLRSQLNEKYAGLGSAHRIMLLEEGMTYQRVGIPPNEAQFLETRKFQVAEIGRLFGITQLHKLGDLERATFSNIEEQNIDFVVDTIRPLVVNIEQEANVKLFYENESEYFVEFVLDGLLRGNTESRYRAYAVARQWGWMSANDILELENQNPIGEQGDMYLVPMNMVPADQARIPEPQQRTLEKRSSAQTRERTANSYKRIFEAAAQKVVQREKQNVLKAAKKHLQERSSSSFVEWLDDFYREFPQFIRREMRAAIFGLTEAIQSIAGEEVNANIGMTPELEKFAEDYMEAYTQRYVGSSRGQLRSIVNQAIDDGDDLIGVVETRLDQWEERRPGKVAMNETVQASNAIARFVFAAAGVSRLRWHALGSKTCPYCQEMDGKVVGIEEPFLARDGELESDDGRMAINRPTRHPPLHQGCVCVIEPD